LGCKGGAYCHLGFFGGFMNVAGQNLAENNMSDSAGTIEKTASQKIVALVLSIMPWAIVGVLLYAGLFIKPTPVIEQVIPHAIDRRDILLGAAHVNDDTYLAAGNYGKIVISEDKGHTWAVQDSTIETHIQDIDSWDEQHAVAVGNLGRVVVTADGGATWKEVTAPKSDISNKLIRVHAYAGGEALAVGEMGMILRTTDYGNTWERLREEEDIFMNDIVRVDENTIMVSAEAREVTEYDGELAGENEEVLDATTGARISARIYKSVDNGQTWETIYTDSPNSFTAIKFRNAQDGVAVGLAGAIVATRDGGNTWTFYGSKVSGMTEHLMDVAWSEELNEWVGIGNKGKWMTFSPDMSDFDTQNLSTKDFTSHSEMALVGDGFIAVGETEGYMDLKTKTWTLLHE